MKKRFLSLSSLLFAVLLLSFSAISTVFGHSPLGPGDNESLATAKLITDPTKSWAIYAELHEGGEAQYFKFEMQQGQMIHVMLFKSTREDDTGFAPGIALFGSELESSGDLPDYVERPADSDVIVLQGGIPAGASFEPFSPGNFYELAEMRLSAPVSGTYYIAVYESSSGGNYGLAVGDRESYSLDELLLLPFSLISIYQWEGQSLVLILLPMISVLIAGAALIVQWNISRRRSLREVNWFGVLGGLFLIGWGGIVLYQLIFSLLITGFFAEAFVTMIFIAAAALLGLGAIRLSSRWEGKIGLKRRAYLLILGAATLVIWAGMLIGSILVMLASLFPRAPNRK